MLKKFVSLLAGDPNKRAIDKLSDLIQRINGLETSFEALSEEALRAKTTEFRTRLQNGQTLNDILPEAFAAVREASKRTIGLRHYDVQLIGGLTLHQGKISEMRTGEGKTLVATLPLYLNALTGRGVHLITVNDYLARRDARWMAPIYNALGLSVGVLQMAARTENGKKAFLVDLERESPHEDQNQLRMVPRSDAYAADITYGTNSEFGFDYLRDNMTLRWNERVQRGFYYAIVDEVDNVLIDEARTPLIISGPASEDTEWYVRMAQVVRQLRNEDYELNERDRNITLTEIGEMHVEELLGIPLRDPDRPEDITPEQARLLGYLEQALRAQFLFKRNKDYLIQAGKVVIVDEFTGRLMPGRRWSDGLHQAVEAKEGVRVQAENVTYATITIQNYFRMYEKLAGMTGTAITEAEEFHKIYKLDVLAIPTNLEYQAERPESGLDINESRDDQGYKFRYYARRDDPSKQPVYWQRKDHPDVIFRTEEAKFRTITLEILRYHAEGRPLLIGTTSVELSDRLSSRLRAEPLRRLAQVQLIRRAWMKANNREEDGRLIEELQYLNAPIEDLPISEMRKMARELEIPFNPDDPQNLAQLLEILSLNPTDQARLAACLQSGVAHQVLNARKHTEESQIIAGAGAVGAVTIATNMAGRGVDIKLGGELPESILESVNRILHRSGHPNPYDLRPEERRKALAALSPEQYGIYEADTQRFLQYMQDMEKVKRLGGLHVIGSERHEARRIDNQLRGRAARQGDPGSSRFYLSLEDELMRRFGGQQVDNIMQRMKIDDAIPMEIGLVGRLVEQSQTRVEGANFDIRKHLLEYDDVLNSQRSRIYSQRDRIFLKDDLSEDVEEMLETEVSRRVPEALKDEEGPWKLLAWLDQIQPPISVNGSVFPSFTLKLLVDYLFDRDAGSQNAQDKTHKTREDLHTLLLGLAEDALRAEEEHLLRAVNNILEGARERLEEQLRDRREALDTFFEGLELGDGSEEEQPGNTRSSREILEEMNGTLRLPIRLTAEEQRSLRDDPQRIKATVSEQMENLIAAQASVRLVGAIERRLDESLDLNLTQLSLPDWDTFIDQILAALEGLLARRRDRLVGDREGGQIGRDLTNAMDKIQGPITTNHIIALLLMIPQGSRAVFDKKTHRRIFQRTTRLSYTYIAAHLLVKRDPNEIAQQVLDHLQQAQAMIRRTWGLNELSRLGTASMAALDDYLKDRMCQSLGAEKCQKLDNIPLIELDRTDLVPVIDELGRRALTEVYRQLILAVITELWVDYLTQMEGLRVSIGLEAYAQRDPLVQYKSKASELFSNLLSNMRLGVITRMFTYQPRDRSAVQTELRRSAAARELELDTAANLPEVAEADLDSEPEPAKVEEAQSAQDSSGQPLSRSQRRRRGRR
jgi:preprotein translocase subunit SecA